MANFWLVHTITCFKETTLKEQANYQKARIKSIHNHISRSNDGLIAIETTPWIIHEGIIIDLMMMVIMGGFKVVVMIISENPIVWVYEIVDFIERLKPGTELSHLSSKDRVLGLDVQVDLCGYVDVGKDLVVFMLEPRNLALQIIQVLLFTHPRPASGFPVGRHSFTLPFI